MNQRARAGASVARPGRRVNPTTKRGGTTIRARRKAVDLFCGAGGTSTGILRAADRLALEVDLIAVNHWDVAIATHQANHPRVEHYQSDVATLDPRTVVPSGRLDVLWASPECRHFSTARAGRPINDQKRADPWQIPRWLSSLYVRAFGIENVPDMRSWGPLNAKGRPIKSRRGEYYQAFLHALRSLGYTVQERILNSADYGDPTTRKRLFILGRRDGKPIRWPEPTHARPGTLLPGMQPWRAAREIIDWSIAGASIFGRKRPLSRNTIDRIIAGLQRFGGPELGPFLVVLRGTDSYDLQKSAKPITLPLATVCGSTGHFGLVEPVAGAFVLGQQSGSGATSDEPMPTVPGSPQHGLAQAFLLPPLGVHARNGKANKPRSVDEPVQTVTAARGGGHLVEAFLVRAGGPERQGKPASIDEPVGTLLTRNHRALVQPFLVHVNHGDNPAGSGRGNEGRVRSINDPAPTVTSQSRGLALVDALLTKYYGTGIAKPIIEPLDAVTSKDRFGLVTFEQDAGLALDIRFRMLQPHELARAQGFPDSYVFTGDKSERVCQIGNAVTVELATALAECLLA